MVFEHALYPHMTVAENMGFGLKMTGHSKAGYIPKFIGRADITPRKFFDEKTQSFIRGQRQRVAIGRAIVRGPKFFYLMNLLKS